MEGIFPSLFFPIMPRTGAHSWVEVEIDGNWIPLDSYINEKTYYLSALQKLNEGYKKTGYSISHRKGGSSCEFNFGEIGFMHMGAVVEDHGLWQDYSEYIKSDLYIPLPPVLLVMVPFVARIANKRIEKIRSS
jgi:hypothetical protein